MRELLHIILCTTSAFIMGCAGVNSVDLSDFTEVKYAPKYASGFTIKATPEWGATLVSISKPWQGADLSQQNVAQNLIILDNQQEATSPPINFEGAYLRGPAKRIIALSSSIIAMIEELGEASKVVGVSGIEYISNPTIQREFSEGRALDIGYGANLNFEAIMALRPDIVLLYGVSGEEISVTSKLRELGIQYIYIGDYAEESPLGKAEWMMVMAEILGRGHECEQAFERIEANYNSLKESLPERATASRPKVMLNSPYRDVWYMPSSRSYMVRMIEDAGGEYIYKSNNSNSTRSISIEEAYTLAKGADVWLNMGAMVRTAEMVEAQNPLFAEMEMVTRRQLFNNTARSTPAGGSDFW